MWHGCHFKKRKQVIEREENGKEDRQRKEYKAKG